MAIELAKKQFQFVRVHLGAFLAWLLSPNKIRLVRLGAKDFLHEVNIEKV